MGNDKTTGNTMVKCPNNTFTINYHGLVNMDHISTCKITTKFFTLLPKSTNANLPSFINKTKQITILDNEWIKVAIKFDERRTIYPQKEEQPPEIPSWADFENITNLLDEDIKIFGSYTILVHSITIIFIVTLLKQTLGDCLPYRANAR